MSSKHFIEQIYQYTELSPGEKRIVDEHVLQCESCRQSLAEFMAGQAMLRRAAGIKVEPGNAARLTVNIMEAVQTQMSRSNLILSWLDNALVRYGMMACSLALVFVFAMQELRTTKRTNQNTSQNTALSMNVRTVVKSDVLNTTAMLRDMRDNYLNKCETKSWYACIKEGECDSQILNRIKSSHALYATH